MEFLRAINALMNRGSFFIASAQLQSRIINAIHNKGGNALLCCKPLAYTHATRKFPTGNLQKNSKHCLCHDTDEIPHTFLSSVWLNFHREPWVVTPKIELNTKQTVVKTEHFTAVFLYPFLGRT